MKPRISIDQAIGDRNALGAALGDDLESWRTWRVVLKAAFGEALTDDEREIFASVAGDTREPPHERVRELWAICSRRSGKSRIAALVAVFCALYCKHKAAAGETLMVLVLAASTEQARVVFGYVKGFLDASDLLHNEIENSTQSEITLRNGVVIGVHSNSHRTTRGRTLVACVLDEIAFWYSDGQNSDQDSYTALLPSLATTKGLMLGISTPYRRIGLLHQKYRDHHGVNGDVLVVQGDASKFNPTLDQAVIQAQREADPQGAKSEWDALFRSDLTQFLDDDLVDAAVNPARPLELPPQHSTTYFAFTDAAGGGADSYTLSICHKGKDGRIVIDLVRGTRRKNYNPSDVTAEYAALCKEYRIFKIVGDNYAAHWVSDAWKANGISYAKSELSKSQIFNEALAIFTRSHIELPDHPVLLRELRLLERQTHRSGSDSISHPRGGHDDHANAVCGVAWLASKQKTFIRTQSHIAALDMMMTRHRGASSSPRVGQQRVAPQSAFPVGQSLGGFWTGRK
jgi:hypothetical protein